MAESELFSVEGQVVLVAGATRGIGRAIAEGFARSGAHVVGTGRTGANLPDLEAGLRAAGGTGEGLACDLSVPGEIPGLVERVLSEHGRIDTLVNAAGINRRRPALEVGEEDWDAVLDTNLKGAFLLSREVGRAMCARGAGRQIQVASLTTDRPLRHVLPYAASKAGLGQMTRALALEWGEHGVNVNALAPGFILTDLTRKLWSDDTMQAWNRANTPQRRLGRPEDMVGTAIFLAAPASAFLTGQVITVDGGFSAGWSWPIPG